MTGTSSHPSPVELLSLARRVAVEAGERVARMRADGVEVAATKSSITDVVTAADQAAEQFAREAIAAERPDDGYYGEEGARVDTQSGITWVVDPIDGTVNYLYGIPHYAVSVAAVIGDPTAEPASFETLAGAVANPVTGEVFTAARDEGAFLNDAPIACRVPGSMAEALVATGFSYDASRRDKQARRWASMAGRMRDLRRLGAASLDLCFVAAGRLDGYFESGLHPWDHAAGALIAREAGARVGGADGSREGSAMTIAAHPEFFVELAGVMHSGASSDEAYL